MSQPEPIDPYLYAVMKWIIVSVGSFMFLMLMWFLKRILSDWLDSRRKDPVETYCPMHESHERLFVEIKKEVKECEKMFVEARTRFVDRTLYEDSILPTMERLDNRSEKIESKLDRLQAEMASVKIAIEGLKKN